VALVEEDRVLSEESTHEGMVHSERLLVMIDGACRASRCTVRDLSAIAVSIGPGSFTGLRIGLSVAKGLAYATGASIVAVPTLHAIALEAADDTATRGVRMILASLDARRDEVYCQLFHRTPDGLAPDGEAADCAVTELAGKLAGLDVALAGTGAAKVARVLPPSARWIIAGGERGCVSSARVALEGARMLARGELADASTLEPRYIKEFFLARHH